MIFSYANNTITPCYTCWLNKIKKNPEPKQRIKNLLPIALMSGKNAFYTSKDDLMGLKNLKREINH